jgi:hypothetical protein
LGKVSEGLPDSREVAFALVEIKSLDGCGVCFEDAAGRSEDLGEIEQGVGMVAYQVRVRGQLHCRVGEFHGFGVAATMGQDSGRQSLADDLGGVLAGTGFSAYRDQVDGFVIPVLTLCRDGSGQ